MVWLVPASGWPWGPFGEGYSKNSRNEQCTASATCQEATIFHEWSHSVFTLAQ